jgi:hypothetical protein
LGNDVLEPGLSVDCQWAVSPQEISAADGILTRNGTPWSQG